MAEFYNKSRLILLLFSPLRIFISLHSQEAYYSISSKLNIYKYSNLSAFDLLFENAKSPPYAELAQVKEEVEKGILNR